MPVSCSANHGTLENEQRFRTIRCSQHGVALFAQDLMGVLEHTGFIFQGYNLFPALTARQQLEIVLKWGEGVGSSDARQRAFGSFRRA